METRLGPCWEGTSRLLLHTGTPYIIKQVFVFFFLSGSLFALTTILLLHCSFPGFPIFYRHGEGETLDHHRIFEVRRSSGMKNDIPHKYWYGALQNNLACPTFLWTLDTGRCLCVRRYWLDSGYTHVCLSQKWTCPSTFASHVCMLFLYSAKLSNFPSSVNWHEHVISHVFDH